MDYIMENDAKKEKEQKKEEKYTKTKKKVVAKVNKEERKAEPKVWKVTRLYKPALSAGKPLKQTKRVTKKWGLDALMLDICQMFLLGN